MIKAIIFDWGGVLIENPTDGMIEYIARALGIRSDMVYPGVDQDLMMQFQKGHVSEDRVWERMCAAFEVPKPASRSLWKEAFEKAYRPQKEVFSLARDLKRAGYKLGFLSNTEAPAMEFFYEQQYDFFDGIVFSCAEGLVKPEVRIYEIALDRLHVSAQEAVFIDDRPDFIAGAEAAGLHGVLFECPEQVSDALVALGVNLPEGPA